MTPHIYGIFETANAIEDKEERIFYIRSNRNYVVDTLIKMAYTPDMSFDLPEGEPPFEPSIFDAYGNIYMEIKRIERVFLKGTLPGMKPTQRENLFISVLEYLDKDDAKLLIAVKDKQLGKMFRQLNLKFIKEAFPEYF
jgi:hypothetical protein